jgi:hypothetical protein
MEWSEIFEICFYTYLGGFALLCLVCVANKLLKLKFPNWYRRHIAPDFSTTPYPPECFTCNLDERYCYKRKECKVIARQLSETNCN